MSVCDVIGLSFAAGNHRHRDFTLDEFYNNYVASLREGNLIVHRHLADGRIIKVTHEPMAQGGWVAIYEDITERHRAEESIAHMARHDALTQLPNRVLLREKMAEGLARIETHGETMAVCYLDLDNFKGVNDTLGHPIGDKLLGIIAERVRGVVGEDDTIARLGGDEFAVLQSNSSAEAAGKLARRLVEVISEPIDIDGQEINSGVSIGIALAPNDGSAADHLMKCADLALYRAKAEGRGTFRFFEPDMDARIQARRALEVDLRRALTSRRVRARLPAADQSRRQRAGRHGGAAALAPPGARAGAAVGVHPARRGNRADRPARRMGAARGLQGCGAAGPNRSGSRSTSRRCSSAIAGWSRW